MSASKSILVNHQRASLKKLAWAYGCALYRSEDEKRLGEILRERILGSGSSTLDPDSTGTVTTAAQEEETYDGTI